MRERMLLGRYYEADSWIHRLDPRAKTAAMALYMIAVFMTDSYADVLAVLVFSLLLMKASAIPLIRFLQAMKPLLFILLFVFAFHALFDASGSRLIGVGPVNLYAGGLLKGMMSASRMMLFVTFTALLTFTTKPDRLAQGLGSLMAPLRYVRVSPERLSLMIGIALRFIPTVFEEAERIWKAQASRGMDFRSRTLREKARLAIALLVPVTAGACRRAADLADSMTARGYRLGRPRTAFAPLVWARADSLFIVLFALLAAAVFFVN